MKINFIVLSLLVVLLGCSAQAPTTADGANPGDDRSTNPVVVGNDTLGSLMKVCSALSEKMNVLDDYVVQRELLPVTYQESDCAGKLSAGVQSDVRVIKSGAEYAFQNEDNNFHFPEVETLNSGAMKEICTAINIGPLKNPIITSSRTAVAVSVVESEVCRNDSHHACVQVLRGPVSSDGLTYTVSDSTILKFRVVGDHRGFFVYKNVKSFSTCTEKKFRTKIANFF